MKPLTPLERRKERKSRDHNQVDMNLVSLIDVFTLLIFFLMSNTGAVETLASPRAVKLPESKKGFVPLPRRWIVERSFAWAARFRRLARDYERLPDVLRGLHFLVFVILMLPKIVPLIAAGSA